MLDQDLSGECIGRHSAKVNVSVEMDLVSLRSGSFLLSCIGGRFVWAGAMILRFSPERRIVLKKERVEFIMEWSGEGELGMETRRIRYVCFTGLSSLQSEWEECREVMKG